MNIILDLDNTLICAVEMYYYDMHKEEMKFLDDNLEHVDMDTSYRIYSRPHMAEFIQFLARHFNVSVFTAASKDYALFIIENIIKKAVPDLPIDFIFHSYHTELSYKYYDSPKDLRLLWDKFPTSFTPENTFIVDDLPDVKNANGFNCINVKAFEVVDEEEEDDSAKVVIKDCIDDNELLGVQEMLKLFIED